ncbi:MAG: hypothetical protein COA73_06520 [Candidatus Hydrogenedentota bacterium]|nr:MAG: hypothetical protein COA73_06520 [Candidatus Hydrogenedentota bacterium]
MNSTIRLALFGLLVIAQLGVPISMIMQNEEVISEGALFKFRTAPVDPYDAFRGKYVVLRFEESQVELTNPYVFEKDDTAYALLQKDNAGFANITNVVPSPPPYGDYLRVRINWVRGTSIRLQLPFDRYYMPEELAPLAEKVVRDNSRITQNETYIMVSILNGNAQIIDLYIGNQTIRGFLETHHD